MDSRAARHQLNDDLVSVQAREGWLPGSEETWLELVCECSNDGCEDRILVRGAEYEEARTDGYFLVKRGHEHPEAERPVLQNGRLTIVHCLDEAARLAGEQTVLACRVSFGAG